MFWKYLSGPLIGAVIGYFTNYIAVKMLFYPRKEIKVAGKTLPFTPGAIPKGKPRLARAVGKMIEDKLFTGKDLAETLITEETEKKITGKIFQILSSEVKETVLFFTEDEEAYQQMKQKISEKLGEEIISSMLKMQIGNLLSQKIKEAVLQKVKGSMMGMFVSEELIQSITEPLGVQIEKYLEVHGREYTDPIISSKLTDLEQKTVFDILESFDVEEETVRENISMICHEILQKGIEQMAQKIKIGELVEEKINAMDVDELEDMVVTVMKTELNTIVSLGALIGFVLGIVNVFF